MTLLDKAFCGKSSKDRKEYRLRNILAGADVFAEVL
jgi:hypothetical protein